MNIPTPQQEGFYRELARLCDLIVLHNGEISSQRRALGCDIRPEGYRFLFRGLRCERGAKHRIAGYCDGPVWRCRGRPS
jgi:hypothetical protein